ncbi:MAG: reverse transcriptase domain-containing protein [Desulfosalsimonadaceae bacterium]|nr:reverse transcriptase domain-containing protein [Desulfosalsimonadaceae bacterium]
MMTTILNWDNFRDAFLRVEASHGMAGVDGVTILEFQRNLDRNLGDLRARISKNTYRPWPLLRFQVAKPDNSPRTLCVPAVCDRVAQAAVLNVIGPRLEKEFEDASFAYRKGRSVKQAVFRIRDLRDQGFRYVVDADIEGYFDNIHHDKLMDRVCGIVTDPAVAALIRAWVKAEVYDGQRIFVPEKGIPQGSVVSPALANLFLDDLDEAMLGKGFKLVRYSDDFLVLAKTQAQAQDALELTEEVLEGLGLALDWDDTCLTTFDKGFKFLGAVFLKDCIFSPFDRPAKERKILYMPPPFDIKGYLAGQLTINH